MHDLIDAQEKEQEVLEDHNLREWAEYGIRQIEARLAKETKFQEFLDNRR